MRRLCARTSFKAGSALSSFASLGERSFQVLQRKRQLIVANAFGLAAEVRAADLCQNVLELRVANRELIALGKCCIACRRHGRQSRSLRPDQRVQRVDIPRQSF